MGGRDHSCEGCGRGGFNDPDGVCECAQAPGGRVEECVRVGELFDCARSSARYAEPCDGCPHSPAPPQGGSGLRAAARAVLDAWDKAGDRIHGRVREMVALDQALDALRSALAAAPDGEGCTCEVTGECTHSMSGPTCLLPDCPPCQHPELDHDPNCPVHGEPRADGLSEGEPRGVAPAGRSGSGKPDAGIRPDPLAEPAPASEDRG